MSRRAFRCVLGVLILAGGLSLALPAEAAGKTAQEPDVWSLALRWAAELWDAKVAVLWETQGWQLDPNGGAPSGDPGDQGWQLDPNG